jgi:hypothetical protein
MQYDDATEQRPAEHSCEQHSALCEQALPDVLHVTLSGSHAPLTHDPLQQAASDVHASRSEAHSNPAEQRPATHESAQQSTSATQRAAAGAQRLGPPSSLLAVCDDPPQPVAATTNAQATANAAANHFLSWSPMPERQASAGPRRKTCKRTGWDAFRHENAGRRWSPA